GNRLRDLGERLQLGDASLRLRVELRVLDRLRNLRRDRDDELLLVPSELARLDRADVQRARQTLTREDRDREDRLVLVLRQGRELREAGVEMRLRRDHDRRALGGGSARYPLARPHARALGHLLDLRAVRRPEDELVTALVVEVDEARVRVEHLRHLARDEPEHFFEIERRVDRLDRLGQQAEMALSYIHSTA